MAQKLKLTITVVKNLRVPEKGQVIYRDTLLPGFGVRVGRTVKTYFAEKRVKGKNIRTTIGRHPLITAEKAREEAQKLLGTMVLGVNPVSQKREAKAKAVPLREVFDDFFKARKDLKSRTIFEYRRALSYYFPDWAAMPIVSITKDMVQKRHQKIGKKNGKAQANLAMRVLRAILNFASGKYEDSNGCAILPENPVRRLSQTKAWYRVDRRQTLIKVSELADWYKGVMALSAVSSVDTAESVRDYLIFLLFTGLRRAEGASLKWEQINFKEKTFTITDTKNSEPLTLPLSDFLYALLLKRFAVKVNEYVFHGREGVRHIVEPKKQIQKVIESTGLKFTCHDLRRTFLTVAESLDIPAYALKKLVNHKMKNDVTAGYLILDIERLRRPMQQVTDYLLKKMEVKETGSILFLPSYKKI